MTKFKDFSPDDPHVRAKIARPPAKISWNGNALVDSRELSAEQREDLMHFLKSLPEVETVGILWAEPQPLKGPGHVADMLRHAKELEPTLRATGLLVIGYLGKAFADGGKEFLKGRVAEWLKSKQHVEKNFEVVDIVDSAGRTVVRVSRTAPRHT